MIRISFFTLGCRLNQSETVLLEGVFRDNGFKVVSFSEPADVAVINSCTVTAAADSDARSAVNRAVRLNGQVRVAVIGCQAQVQKKKILVWPNVSWVVGTAQKMQLMTLIRQDLAGPKRARAYVAPIRRSSFVLPFSKSSAAADAARVRANIKIQDGCDNYCAYCEIPYARGRSRSRVFKDVLLQAGELAAEGYKEIVITGVNVGDFADDGKTLVDVIKGIEHLPGVERIRISSIEHTKLPLALIKLMRPPHKLCRFLHLPIQSGCDRILKRMGRDYTGAQMESLVRKLQENVPQIMIGTDIIVGFPGETEADFNETVDFLSRVPFHYFHVFSYSHRERARSRVFKGVVPDGVIAKRSKVLRELSRAKRAAFLSTLIGTTQNVLFEQKKDDHWIGHTDNYVTIKMKLQGELKNVMLPVLLSRVDAEAVIATPIEGFTHDGSGSKDQRSCRGA
ncbi:MAG: tRNA (N(6)-L-threonylcarbamoyladenosine(37)-C(2))-methylthiotransferase MtaB [Candidatus Omnitrophica bacterium]|nr:tRNA (N(6)-L-threonylcarbamoyladenosine(37)-C(2))-methylthiotransferase MtaB [Candidatus Omnitrophota bacterium]